MVGGDDATNGGEVLPVAPPEADRKGRHRPERPAEPGDDHHANFNAAIDDMLRKMKSRDEPGGQFVIGLEVEINPGSIREYRVVPRP